jgi:hypothetical protein
LRILDRLQLVERIEQGSVPGERLRQRAALNRRPEILELLWRIGAGPRRRASEPCEAPATMVSWPLPSPLAAWREMRRRSRAPDNQGCRREACTTSPDRRMCWVKSTDSGVLRAIEVKGGPLTGGSV